MTDTLEFPKRAEREEMPADNAEALRSDLDSMRRTSPLRGLAQEFLGVANRPTAAHSYYVRDAAVGSVVRSAPQYCRRSARADARQAMLSPVRRKANDDAESG